MPQRGSNPGLPPPARRYSCFLVTCSLFLLPIYHDMYLFIFFFLSRGLYQTSPLFTALGAHLLSSIDDASVPAQPVAALRSYRVAGCVVATFGFDRWRVGVAVDDFVDVVGDVVEFVEGFVDFVGDVMIVVDGVADAGTDADGVDDVAVPGLRCFWREPPRQLDEVC